jgi:hypothetical protein
MVGDSDEANVRGPDRKREVGQGPAEPDENVRRRLVLCYARFAVLTPYGVGEEGRATELGHQAESVHN